MYAGSITRPFTLEFHNVLEKENQNTILQLIDTFFEDIPKKQRAINFYESEIPVIDMNSPKIFEVPSVKKLLLSKRVK